MRFYPYLLGFCLLMSAILACRGTVDRYRHSEALRSEKYIAIQPININHIPFKNEVVARIKKGYFFKGVIIRDNISPPETFINQEKGKRYNASMILNWLSDQKPDSCALIVGLTDADIYITKRDEDGNIKKPEYKYKVWGIFGLGKNPGNSCVVSTYRIKTPDRSLYKDRFLKIVLHEIGHNLGLKHCPDKDCYMTDAVETIRTIDNASLQMCTECKKKISTS